MSSPSTSNETTVTPVTAIPVTAIPVTAIPVTAIPATVTAATPVTETAVALVTETASSSAPVSSLLSQIKNMDISALVSSDIPADTVSEIVTLRGQMQDISGRLSTLLSQNNVRQQIQNGMESSISGLTTTLLDLNRDIAVLTERTSRVEDILASMPGSVSNSINAAVNGTNNALQVSLASMNGQIGQISHRVSTLESINSNNIDVQRTQQSQVTIARQSLYEQRAFVPPVTGVAPVATAAETTPVARAAVTANVRATGVAAFLGGAGGFASRP
jgi:TolA-binding protein